MPPNCTILTLDFQIFPGGGACPRTPLAWLRAFGARWACPKEILNVLDKFYWTGQLSWPFHAPTETLGFDLCT